MPNVHMQMTEAQLTQLTVVIGGIYFVKVICTLLRSKKIHELHSLIPVLFKFFKVF